MTSIYYAGVVAEGNRNRTTILENPDVRKNTELKEAQSILKDYGTAISCRCWRI